MDTMLAELEKHNSDKLALSLNLAKDIITKDYLYRLEDYEVAEIPDELKALDIAEYTRFYRFNKIVSDKDESVIDKLVTVLNAAYSSNATVIALISGHQKSTEYYLGVVSKDISQEKDVIETQGETLKGVLTGNFPGLEINSVGGDEKRELIDDMFRYDYITSISGIASVRNEKDNSYEKFVQGIEHLVDSIGGREYRVIVIADPVNAGEIADAKLGYERLYTQLSPFLKTSVSFSESESVTVSQGYTAGVTETIGESTSLTQNYTKTNGWSNGSTHGTSNTKDTGRFAGAVVGAGIGAVGLGVAAAVTGGAAITVPLAMKTIRFASGLGASIGSGLIGSSGTNESETVSESGGDSETSGKTISENRSEASQKSESTNESEGTTQGKTLQITNEDRTIKTLLGKIDKHIERLTKCESYGAFNCATYVISSDPETNALAANGYNALMHGDNSSLQASHINNWNMKNYVGKQIKEYLVKFSHPLFVSPINKDVLLGPATISNSYELAVNMGLPKKSIPGLPVIETASFGRNIESGVRETHRQIEIGNLYHMGRDEVSADGKIPVKLDLDSLTMHTFITGSTGKGKSNTVYSLLERVLEKNKNADAGGKVTFLVIEPAKGEYKDKFGHYKDVAVYGTNKNKTDLLRINPFSFPEDIHILEHIDRLIEIFNVCWPMYAAMPAVLKDAVERAYINAGWDLMESECRYRKKFGENLYPSFIDVLKMINVVMEESKYSSDSKGDYTGALCTRIKSLTNGIYGQIFSGDEIPAEKLFDSNVIADLSRVGSVETKSLIMGLLVLKMQEYRMSSRSGSNTGLKHLTVLEEAHNLLKRTSMDQSSDSANLLGKSVEMLANSIAEMRTYGEGFVIVDQAPGLLDMAVIRNTNTKIILGLPDLSDRELVGRAASLNDSQIVELSRLKTGVAAVYQNNWLELVLCHIHPCGDDETPYHGAGDSGNRFDDVKARSEVVDYLMLPAPKKLELDSNKIAQLERYIFKLQIASDIKIELLRYMKETNPGKIQELRSRIVYSIFNSETALLLSNTEKYDMNSWYCMMLEKLEPSIDEFDQVEQDKILSIIAMEHARRENSPEAVEIRNRLLYYIETRGGEKR